MKAKKRGQRVKGGGLEGFFEFILPRIGETKKERLAWVVRVVQREPRELIPGDWDNLRLELAAFAGLSRETRTSFGVPSPAQTRGLLLQLLGGR